MEIFDTKDYRDFLRHQIAAHSGIRGYQTLLAEAAGCQRSYLSQVLHSHVHLTPDHAARLAAYWQLSEDETDFFLELLAFARAGSDPLRKIAQRRLETLRARRQSVSRRAVRSTGVAADAQALYYSSWHFAAVHLATAFAGLETENALAARLELPLPLVRETLAQLERIGLARREGGRWRPTQDDVHLAESSSFLPGHHLHWRSRAIDNIQRHRPSRLHYTGIYSISTRDAERVKTITADAIAAGRKVAAESAEEELLCLNVDFFQV